MKTHCFDGEAFTDSLARFEKKSTKYSQASQIWAALAGAVQSTEAQNLLRRSLNPAGKFTPTSVSMSFYTLRALSAAGGRVYDESFHQFWDPWTRQLDLGVTTWEEDSVSQRSDCHAWGSAPIFEYAAEVAGIQPGERGWSKLVFKPRVALYKDFAATVPLGGLNGQLKGRAHVSWKHDAQAATAQVTLRFDMVDDAVLEVAVVLPGVDETRTTQDGDLVYDVKIE